MTSSYPSSIKTSPLSSVPSSDHDDRWETKEEAVSVSPTPEAPGTMTREEMPTKVRQGSCVCAQGPHLSLTCQCSTQPPEIPAPAHRPPEDEGEEDEGEVDEGEEDEEWEDMSEDVTEDEEEEEEIEEEEGAEAQEEEQDQDHQHPQAEPTGDPTQEQADLELPTPQEPLSPAPAAPSSPFSPPGGHQPVPDWGEEMELNSPRMAHPLGSLSPGEAWPFGNA